MLVSSSRVKGSIKWWWGFGLLIGMPALLLAIIGLRVARAERIQDEQREREQQTQLARLVDASLTAIMAEIENKLRRIDNDPLNQNLNEPFSGWHVVSFRRNGPIVFYQDKIYFVEAETDAHLKPVPAEWPPEIEGLIEQAQTAEAQRANAAALRAYERVATAEPGLSDWAKLSRARITQDSPNLHAAETLSDPGWSDSNGFTPSGLPVAIVAASLVEQLPRSQQNNFIPLIKRTVENLDHGRWWLEYDERKFYGEELRRLLEGLGVAPLPEDERLREVTSLGRIIQQSTPSRRDITHSLERDGSQRFLIAWLPATNDSDAWTGIATSDHRLAKLLDDRLAPILPVNLSTISIRDDKGDPVWGTLNNPSGVTQTETLRSIVGWEIALQNAGATGWSKRKEFVWYGFIGLLVVMLVTGLAMTINVVRREEELAQRQNEFVATVSHEFKSPITGVRLLMERLQHGRVFEPETAKEYYGAIDRELVRLERHVDRLLETQRLQDGLKQYRFTPTALAELITSAISEFQPLADARKIRLETRIESNAQLVLADQTAVRNAIENLLDNAIKFSSSDSRVLVSLCCVDSKICVKVCDEGIGITAGDQRKIFERFYRGSRAEEQNTHGSGLGLALVKAVADAHGGSIEVSSVPGKGSQFSLLLPIGGGSQNGGTSTNN
ncbi:MAG TPA: HAMP domain-containing sensor histidine kinase [Pyrinomonadaceae bacterium]|nr:HAMP domain-containing sensor histidine kinase [Pyrinomonadaceae bacterium]